MSCLHYAMLNQKFLAIEKNVSQNPGTSWSIGRNRWRHGRDIKLALLKYLLHIDRELNGKERRGSKNEHKKHTTKLYNVK